MRYGTRSSRLFYEYWEEKLVRPLGVIRNGWILDLGSGTGFLLRRLSDATTNGKRELVGIDISLNMLECARIITERAHHLILADGTHLPLRSHLLDGVVCLGSLHHMHDIEAAVCDIRRTLKQGGVFVFSETHRSWILEPFRMILRFCRKFSRLHRAFSHRYIDNLIRRNGFRVLETRHFGYIGFALLGFPDILPIGKYFPFWISKFLIRIDEFLSELPLLKHASWHVYYHTRRSRD
jgi:ubiquinone/menaquinone biosynthesis C-methylase UbiE